MHCRKHQFINQEFDYRQITQIQSGSVFKDSYVQTNTIWIIFCSSGFYRHCFPIFSSNGSLQPELRWCWESLPRPGCHRSIFRPAVRCMERRVGLVQCRVAQWRIGAVPHHQTQRAMWRQKHHTRCEELWDAWQAKGKIWCLLFHL